MILIIGLISLGVFSFLFGKLAEYLKLPSLIGMIAGGMLLGPAFFNLIPKELMDMAPEIKDIALVVVLFIGGLGISAAQMKQIGRPAVCLSVIPAVLEGFTVAAMASLLLGFSFIQGSILGFIIAAVSPAVLIPSMINLIREKKGEDKAIPQLLLVGASADDTVAITLFTTFMTLYLKNIESVSHFPVGEIIKIPISIALSIGIGWFISIFTSKMVKNIQTRYVSTLVVFAICLALRTIEKKFHIELFNSLLSIMVLGFFIRKNLEEEHKEILKNMNRFWQYGKLYLFSLVGAAINPHLVGEYFLVGVSILTVSLTIRSIGVLISLMGTDLNSKERLFCVIAYLPKATVQSAKAGIPLQMGVAGGEIMQAVAILSVLITAPIGAIGINMTADRLLSRPFSLQES